MRTTHGIRRADTVRVQELARWWWWRSVASHEATFDHSIGQCNSHHINPAVWLSDLSSIVLHFILLTIIE
jgi:hypothetical protein